MTFIDRLLRTAPTETRSVSYADIFETGRDWIGATDTAAGVAVTDKAALGLSPVYGSIRIITEGVAGLEVEARQGTGVDAKVIDPPSWVDRPQLSDPRISWAEVVEQIVSSMLLRGVGYAATPRADDGTILEVIPLDPDAIETVRLENPRRVVFKHKATGYLYDHTEVAAVNGMMLPGKLTGVSPIDYARETVALGIAAQNFGAAFFGSGAIAGGIIEVDGDLGDTAKARIRDNWNDHHQSTTRAHRIGVLTNGARYKQTMVTPEQAQFLATRGYQIADIARYFGVPPHLLQDASGSTSWGSGLAEQSTNYVVHTLARWVGRIEAWMTRMARSENPTGQRGKRTTLKLAIDHLTRGAYPTRMQAYRTGLDGGIYTIDEVRRFENLPPVPDGEGAVHRIPLYTATPAQQEAELTGNEPDPDDDSAPDPDGSATLDA